MKPRLRTLWLKTHLYLGLTAGLIFSVLGLTGSVLVFHRNLDEWANTPLMRTRNQGERISLANAIAAEHLEIMTADAEGLSNKVRNAGAIFLGAHTPEAIGDYVGGSNHVLPTARSARFSSGLGVLDFMKRTSILKCGPDQLRALGPAAMTLGKAEGLDAHSRSVGLRLNLS